jgi:lipopolysaccharide biosynthesis glycosyltransferase
MDSTVRVVVTADEGYVMPMAASVRSVIDNFGPEGALEVLVLSCGISAASKDRLRRPWTGSHCSIVFADIDLTVLSTMPLTSSVHPTLTPAHYVPLLLSQLLPAEWDRVLCLDVDTITRARLFPRGRNGRYVAAVEHRGRPRITSGRSFGAAMPEHVLDGRAHSCRSRSGPGPGSTSGPRDIGCGDRIREDAP